ncbi:hypothetical protein J2X56_004974 [Herbaspirillum sp. 1173]|uniref:hypothetical protein n=1 Tax=Herbaspirillum sp. 1173 TaxID=2817734 RepID=UPI00285C74C9|nr:hypothetical protein [Herbaspirillum sp. 1173]MDR6742939.1 hypothetical protein [Herbaspirillum sp. 1173]
MRKHKLPDTQITDGEIDHLVSEVEGSSANRVAGGPHVVPLAYYWGLGIVIALVASRRWGQAIQTLLAPQAENCGEQFAINYRGSIGALSPHERFLVCSRALKILKNWPVSLFQICRDLDLRLASLTEFNRGLPYWMHQELNAVLSPRYRPNFDEVKAAARALSNSGQEINRHQLERFIGVIESKHVDIQIAPLQSKFNMEEARNYFSQFDRLIFNTSVSKGQKYRIARDRTITVAACEGKSDLQSICRWTWSEPIVRRAYALSKSRIISELPPKVGRFTPKEIEHHLAWFISNFCPDGGRPNSAVFASRSGKAVDVETVRITSGQVKKLAGLKYVRTCITGLSRRK